MSYDNILLAYINGLKVMSPEMLLVTGAGLLILMFLFNRFFPKPLDPCAGRQPHEQTHISKILDKLEAILDKIEMDLHKHNVEDLAIEQRIDTLLQQAERGLCEQYALWSAAIERDIERTGRDFHLDDVTAGKTDEIETILTRLEGIIAPLDGAQTT